MTTRRQQLEKLHLPRQIVSLATSKHDDDAFFFRCQEISADTPAPEATYPLWQCTGVVTAVRPQAAAKTLEYIQYSQDTPEDYQTIATSLQGLLASLFSELIEDEDWEEEEEEAMSDLTQAAEEVGFEHLKALLQFQEANADNPDYGEALAQWTLSL